MTLIPPLQCCLVFKKNMDVFRCVFRAMIDILVHRRLGAIPEEVPSIATHVYPHRHSSLTAQVRFNAIQQNATKRGVQPY